LIERRAVAVAPLNEQLGDSGCRNHSFVDFIAGM
jgi:hypothetical protein